MPEGALGNFGIIVAHRGLHPPFPENSLEAFGAAWDAGIVWCECDVRLSADGVPVVIHDETLERTTTGSGRVAEWTAAELGKLKLLDSDCNVTKHSIPLLEEALEKKPKHARLMVEPKPALGEKIISIARLILEAGGMLHSFHQKDVELADRATEHRLPCAVLADTADDLRTEIARIHLNYKLLDWGAIPRLRSEGKKIGVWTVNDVEAVRRFADLGVEMIITDIPLSF